jgi:carbon-monoxide dehydrogenase medium subunit
VKNLKEYCRPSSVDEAVRLKRELCDRAVYLGGGTDLLVHRPPTVERAIDIRHAGINFAGKSGDWYVIGGGALLRDAEEAMKDVCGGMLRRALRETAPWLIRNAATVSGNIANASPAADSIPALMVLDAQLCLAAADSDTVLLESVFVGPHRTRLGDRLIREIRISSAAAARQGAFIKLGRSKSDIALVNVAVAFTRDGDRLRDVRIALGAVAPTPIRASTAEAALEGEIASPQMLKEVERLVRTDIRPISDWRASAEYRTRMSGVLVRRAIQQALG